jgi:hypothetical protein
VSGIHEDAHPSWADHDLNQGYRDALALLTATNADDPEARHIIAQTKCCTCTTEALLALVLSCIDEVWGGDVEGFVQTAMQELEL